MKLNGIPRGMRVRGQAKARSKVAMGRWDETAHLSY